MHVKLQCDYAASKADLKDTRTHNGDVDVRGSTDGDGGVGASNPEHHHVAALIRDNLAAERAART